METVKTEVNFTIETGVISEGLKRIAAHKAYEAYIMELLRHHEISAGRTAELLNLDLWKLSDLMSAYNISPFPEYSHEDLAREVSTTLEMLESRDR